MADLVEQETLISRRRALRDLALCLWGSAACSSSTGPHAADEATSHDADAPEASPEPDSGPGDAALDGALDAAPPALMPARVAMLGGLFDALIPGDDASPGAVHAHAADYLVGLLEAFAVTPPRIFAGGPYSGRHGGLDGFATFLPLTRVEGIAWQRRVDDYRERYEAGLDALEAAAQAAHGAGFASLTVDERRALLPRASEDFIRLAYEHAVEGTYAHPIYGGNFERRGWAAIGYEGDRQPIGYTARQMSHPGEG